MESLSQQDRDYLAVVSNPCGDEENGPKSMIARIPDRSNVCSVPLTLTARGNIDGSVGSGVLMVFPPCNGSTGYIGAYVYGGTPYAPTSTATGCTYASSAENSVFDALNAYYPKGYRVVSAAIKVNALSSSTSTAGILRPGSSSYYPYGQTDYNTYGHIFHDGAISGVEFSCWEGITVRSQPHLDTNGAWRTRPSGYTSASAQTWDLPVVYFSGLSATTVLSYLLVLQLEASVSMGQIPFHLWSSKNSSQMDSLIRMLEDETVFPLVSKGRSFATLWKKATHVGKTLAKYAKETGVASLATGLVKATPVGSAVLGGLKIARTVAKRAARGNAADTPVMPAAPRKRRRARKSKAKTA